MAVIVLDKKGARLMPCSEKRARLLLKRKRACVSVTNPFTIQLKDRVLENCILQDRKIDISHDTVNMIGSD